MSDTGRPKNRSATPASQASSHSGTAIVPPNAESAPSNGGDGLKRGDTAETDTARDTGGTGRTITISGGKAGAGGIGNLGGTGGSGGDAHGAIFNGDMWVKTINVATSPIVPQDFKVMALPDIWDLQKLRLITVSNPSTVKLGAILSCSPGTQAQHPVEIASFPKVEVSLGPWTTGMAGGNMTNEGWTRCNAEDVFERNFLLHRRIPTLYSWLLQANYVFSRFGITSNFEDFILLQSIDFEIFVPSSTQETPTGFLFLCPAENFQITPSSFCWPDYPAYWSRDGVERLSAEEAVRLKFPVLEFNTRILGLSWDSSVYAGLREFLETKAFDPDTQDYAKRNNWPLLQLSTRRENPDADGMTTDSATRS